MKPGLARATVSLMALAIGLMLIGCATRRPKVDWNSRIGIYTYDQTVQELGPPDKSAKLDDGSTIAEWFLRQHSQGGMSIGVGMGSYGPGGGGGVGVNRYYGAAPQSDYLQLTFSPDGKLQKSATVTR